MSKHEKGFTLVEVMIVVLVIGILAGIAIPNFFKARENSQKRTCVQNLRAIAEAKEQYVMAAHLPADGTIEEADLAPNYIKIFPKCPAGGHYVINTADVDPTCTQGGEHTLQKEDAVTIVNSGMGVAQTTRE